MSEYDEQAAEFMRETGLKITAIKLGTFKNFCADFDYDSDSIKALETYRKVQEEYDGMCRLFNEDEREKLAGIN